MNCKAGKCGCAAPRSTTAPHVHDAMDLFKEGEPISVAPIRGFPGHRDLVTDVSYNYVKAGRCRRCASAPEPDAPTG